MNKEKAVIYARSAAKNDLSIDVQLATCRKYAAENDMEIIAEYMDVNYSGMDAKRPGLKELQDNADWNVLLVYDCARLFRKMELFSAYCLTLIRKDRKFISLESGKVMSLNPFNYVQMQQNERARKTEEAV